MSDLDGLDEMFANIPGGSYLLQMLRNDPTARAAIEGIDRTDPDSVAQGMRALLGAFGMNGDQADQMMVMAQQMMTDPEKMAEAARAAGIDPASIPGPHMAAAAGAPAPLDDGAAMPPVATPGWFGVVEQVQRYLEDGSERLAFALLTDTLDHPDIGGYDPRDDAWLGVTTLLEIFAVESVAAGRQLPLRLRDTWQRLAWASDATEGHAPETNPEFTRWAASLVEQRSRPHGSIER